MFDEEKSNLIFAGNMLKYTGGILNKWKEVRCELHEDCFRVLVEKEG